MTTTITFFAYEIELDRKAVIIKYRLWFKVFIFEKNAVRNSKCPVSSSTFSLRCIHWKMGISSWEIDFFVNEWPTMMHTHPKPASFWYSTNLQKNVHSFNPWSFKIVFCFCACRSLSNMWFDCLMTCQNEHFTMTCTQFKDSWLKNQLKLF